MAFAQYLAGDFKHEHEQLMFDALAERLGEELAGEADHHALLGNIMVDGCELDALYVKNNAVAVIELKDYGGELHFSENGPWTASGVEVRGSNYGNPFRQVRQYKFATLNWLSQHSAQLLADGSSADWGHVSGVVVFGRNITFTEQLPSKISPWFHIADLESAVDRLLKLASPRIRLTNDTIARIVGSLEVAEVPKVALPGRLKVVYHNNTDFREAITRMRKAGGAKQKAAHRVLEMIQAAREGRDLFAMTNSREVLHIEGARLYDLYYPCKLVAVRHTNVLYLCFAGDEKEVEQWCEVKRGLTFAMDAATGRISVTHVSPDPATPTELPPPTDFTTQNRPYLARVKGLDLASLVPPAFIRRTLERIDEGTSDQDVFDLLDSVSPDDVRAFLQDVIGELRKGDAQAAQARIDLRNGVACAASEAGTAEARAVSNRINSEHIFVASEQPPEELARMLDPDKFREWMIYLHPDQKAVVEMDFDRPAILTGVSGSGKTCILIHRARRLAQKYEGERIGILTLNRSLARLLRNLVDELCLGGEGSSIEVLAFYDYFQRLIRELGAKEYLADIQNLYAPEQNIRVVAGQTDPHDLANAYDPRSGEGLEDTWSECWNSDQTWEVRQRLSKYLEWEGAHAEKYLRDELMLIRSAFSLRERSRGYAEMARHGRVIRLDQERRDDVLSLLRLYEEWMLAGHMMDEMGLSQILIPAASRMANLPAATRFRCLLIDEFQDFSTLDLRLLGRIPTAAENGLFLAGDRAQKIFTKTLDLGACALGRGSAATVQIKKNYRNSLQILDAASLLVAKYGSIAQGQGVDVELLDPELAARETAYPIAKKSASPIADAWLLAQEWLRDADRMASSVCIATANPAILSVEGVLGAKPDDLSAEELSGDYMVKRKTMVVGALADVKGFEFSMIIIVGLDSDQFPDKDQPHDECWRDALRLYVAMTRGRDQVVLIYSQTPSEFLTVMKEKLTWQ